MEIKNGEITAYVEFLQNLNLKSRASRGRTKLIKLLDKKIDEFNADLNSVRDEFFKKDDKGHFVQDDNGKLVIKDGVSVGEAQAEADKLTNENAVILLDEYEQQIKAMYQALDEYDGELSGTDATIYDDLMEKLEQAQK
ncbi:DUF1617 family protein [Ligilactobacillus aviarius]|uniref:DUF1617 family protein n=1 Tax=Ligilactobacillus aviarius TaxID=1606 RepID=UPI00388F5DE4